MRKLKNNVTNQIINVELIKFMVTVMKGGIPDRVALNLRIRELLEHERELEEEARKECDAKFST